MDNHEQALLRTLTEMGHDSGEASELSRRVLDAGVGFPSQKLSPDEMDLVLRRIGRFSPQTQSGIVNSQHVLMWDLAGTFSYAEGFAIDPLTQRVRHHAWLVLQGRVIDLTWRRLEASPLAGFDVAWAVIGEHATAYRGILFTRAEVMAQVRQRREWTSMLRPGLT